MAIAVAEDALGVEGFVCSEAWSGGVQCHSGAFCGLELLLVVTCGLT